MKHFSDLLATLLDARKTSGLSYVQIAKRSGLTPLAVRHAMQGKAAPKITSLIAIADALGLEFRLVPQAQAAIFDSMFATSNREAAAPKVVTLIEQALKR